MSQHHHQLQYVPYIPPGTQNNPPQAINGTISPHSTTLVHPQPQPQQQPQQLQQPGLSGSPLVAQGDWTKSLVDLANTAELKYVFWRPFSL